MSVNQGNRARLKEKIEIPRVGPAREDSPRKSSIRFRSTGKASTESSSAIALPSRFTEEVEATPYFCAGDE